MSAQAPIATKLVSVPHLSGTKISYAQPKPLTGSKPTLVLINPSLSSAAYWKPQFSDEALTDSANLIAFEPLGHGNSTTNSPMFTYWDSAIAFIQALDALGVKKAFILGSSAGGNLAVRTALLAPDRILGIIPVNTSLGSDNARNQEAGSSDHVAGLKALVNGTKDPNPDWTLPEEIVRDLAKLNLGPNTPEETLKGIYDLASKSYNGDAGRQRVRQVFINLLTGESLHLRIGDIKAPVLWLHGAEDKVITAEGTKGELALFGSSDKTLETIAGAYHGPTATHAKDTNPLIAAFVKKHGGKPDASRLREAVGMVDI